MTLGGRAAARAGDEATACYLRAAARARRTRPQQAIGYYRHALARQPGLAGAWLGLGHALKTVGRQDEAIAAYRRAGALRPDAGEIYYSLANLQTFTFRADEVAAMLRHLESGRLAPAAATYFAFALARHFEDSGDYERAFAYYLGANRRHRRTIRYQTSQTRRIHGAIRSFFSARRMATIGRADSGGHPGPTPIFILGLPRSGSTLLEQILCSHSQVDGAGELPVLGALAQALGARYPGTAYPGALTHASRTELRQLGDTYIDQTRQYRSGGRYFTDKMPNNFPHIGFLRLILPGAKIIDARRHPLDSCLGCFQQRFSSGQRFSYALSELGEFYLEYRELMAHWDAVMPGEVLRVQYEDVVADLQTQVRRILDFCGLPFEDACLNFQQTERPVPTASALQVRRPIYKESVHRWRRFEHQLQSLAEMLHPLLPGTG